MHARDHAPPHFHALYAEHEALIDIRGLRILGGSLPGRIAGTVLEWASQHQQELLEDWNLCAEQKRPLPIEPMT
jgi:hypothetical protein